MIISKKSEYETAIESITHIIPALANVPDYIIASATEIRLKSGQTAVIRNNKENYFLQTLVSTKMMEECIASFCRYSVHNYENDLADGFVTLKGGHRAGFSGKAVYTNGKVSFIKNVSSINIRIARQHIGCADRLAELFFSSNVPKGILIIGKPLSGKTTVLRDLCRSVGNCYRISVIDERNELSATYNGIPQLDVGKLSDVFTGFYKNDGIVRAIRTMSPQYIALDESGFDASLSDYCFNSGVGLIMTAHCDSIEDVYLINTLSSVLKSGSISHIALLSKSIIGHIEKLAPVSSSGVLYA